MPRRRLIAATLFLIAAAFITPLQRDLFVGDETKYGQVVREMRATGAFFLPTLEGTPFTRRVYEVVRRIPRGKTRTYGDVAEAAGKPGAARAVGNVMSQNPVCLFIPCHRVVASTGIGGWGGNGGIRQKQFLLDLERG